jgi:hypothetical protein
MEQFVLSPGTPAGGHPPPASSLGIKSLGYLDRIETIDGHYRHVKR